MENREAELLHRYFRKTKANPEGQISHHGDCDYENLRICNCGLLHFLTACNPEIVSQRYPEFNREKGEFEKVRTTLVTKTRRKKA